MTPEKPSEFSVFLRAPGWSQSSAFTVDGMPAGDAKAGQYFEIHRLWKTGDRILAKFDMKAQ